MALCRQCSTVIPCHCHVAPPTQVRPGVYRATKPYPVSPFTDESQIDGYLWQHVTVRRDA